MKELSIVTSCYKKEQTVLSTITSHLLVLDSLGVNYEYIAVIDGEVDNTEAVLQAIKHKRFKLVSYKENQGKGFALRTGFKLATGKFIGHIDADHDINPELLGRMYKKIIETKADIIYPNKFNKESNTKRSLLRTFLSIPFNLQTRILFKFNVKDTQTGSKLYKSEVIKKVFPYCIVNGIGFDVEIFAFAYKLGYKKFVEVPVKLNPNEYSSMKLKHGINFFFDIWGIFKRYR